MKSTAAVSPPLVVARDTWSKLPAADNKRFGRRQWQA
jgi:hypothetical protein